MLTSQLNQGKNNKSNGSDRREERSNSYKGKDKPNFKAKKFRTDNTKSTFSKPKRKGDCETLGENVYFIGDARQADNYTKVTENILNYIQSNYTNGFDVKTALEQRKDFDFNKIRSKAPISSRVSDDDDEEDDFESTDSKAQESLDTLILNAEIKQYVERRARYNDNMNKAYALILGQCTLGLKGKLEQRKDWDSQIKHKAIKLLDAIKEITHNYQDSKYPIALLLRLIKTFMNIKQEEK